MKKPDPEEYKKFVEQNQHRIIAHLENWYKTNLSENKTYVEKFPLKKPLDDESRKTISELEKDFLKTIVFNIADGGEYQSMIKNEAARANIKYIPPLQQAYRNHAAGAAEIFRKFENEVKEQINEYIGTPPYTGRE